MAARTVAKPGSNGKKRIILVDDHTILRQGLSELIAREQGFMICGEAATPADALVIIARTSPDLVIVDISLGEGNGLTLLRDLRERYPELPMLVLSMHDELLYAERALRAGARGYLMKHEGSERLIHALREILAGRIFVSESIAEKILHNFTQKRVPSGGGVPDRLSDREWQVLELIGQGRKTREIAEELRLSVKTVESHREHIKRKLNLDSSVSLVRFAVQWVEKGLGTLPPVFP